MIKYLKGFLVGIGILLFGTGFSNALDLHLGTVGSTTLSYFDNSFSINVFSNSFTTTKYLGTTKNILAFGEYDYFFWLNSGFPDVPDSPFISDYYPGSQNGRYYNSNQGIINNYLRCDSFTGTDINNCQNKDYTGSNINDVSQVLGNIDKYLYGNFVGSNVVGENYQAPIFCFSSSEYNKSVCFYACSHLNCGSSSARGDIIGGIYPPRNLNSRVGDDWSFGDIPNNRIGLYSGFVQGGNVYGTSSIAQDVNVAGNLVYNSCTNGYIINKIEYNYGIDYRYVCYAGSYDTGNVTSDYTLFNSLGYGLNIIELYNLTSNGQSRKDWFNSNSYAIQKFREGRLNANPFLSSPIVLYSYFDILYDEGYIPSYGLVDDPSNPYTILNYCKLVLYPDYNAPYEYGYFKSYCDELDNSTVNLTTGDVGSVDGSGELLPPGFNQDNSGSAVAVDWSGILSGETNRNFDGKTFINDVYQKFQSKLIKPYYGATIGIVPNFILVFLFALILFRVLQH